MSGVDVVAQTTQPRSSISAYAVVAALVTARVAVAWGRNAEWSPLVVLALVGQDAIVASAAVAVEAAANRFGWNRPLLSIAFWLLVVYTAINVVIARVLPTPLTLAMIGATGAPLLDSVRTYLTASSISALLLVVIVATVAARVIQGAGGLRLRIAGGLLVLAVAGTAAQSRVETWGLHRNAVVTLIGSARSPSISHPSTEDWRALSPSGSPALDVTALRGTAKGLNVLIIGLESTAAQYLQSYGAADAVTPRLDELANQALIFDAAYAASPDSIRSLFSIACARYPAFDTPPDAFAATPCGSLTEALKALGYHTALFHSGRFSYLGMNAVIQNRGIDLLEDAGHIGGNHESSFGVDEPATVERMLSWIDGLPSGESFVMTYLPVAGHHPYATNTPGAFGTATDFDRYRSALHEGDTSIGVLIDGLKTRGLFDKTMVVVYGDHGQAFGQHPGNVGHTFSLYEENVRVPLFIALPVGTQTQIRSDVEASLIDVLPTLFELLGLEPDSRHQGRTLLDGSPGPVFFFADSGANLAGLRDGRWKFIHDLDTGRSRLFDLDRDPAEQSDLSMVDQPRVNLYTSAVTSWASSQKAGLLRADRP